jgi:hypothetical protein
MDKEKETENMTAAETESDASGNDGISTEDAAVLPQEPEDNENTEYGIFKSPQDLLKAYENLENEYKEKCGILEKLKEESVKEKMPQEVDYTSNEFIEKHILTNKAAVDRVISEYLKELYKQKSVPKTINGSGGFIPFTPPEKPKTIAEAGRMAEKMLSGDR